ncbi:MAG: glycosyltransferase family 4 protein [Patescibacteria group bacterium]|jgi:glycosyltransferase involved in cell wall biosynthesis
MRITFIATKLNLDKGGSNPDLYLKIKALTKLGHDILLITVFSEINKLPSDLSAQVKEEFIKPRSQFNIQRQTYKILKKYSAQTDVFHIEGHFLYGGGLYRLFGGRIPVVAFFNRELVSWPPFSDNFAIRLKQKLRFLIEKKIGGWLANHIDFFIFTSPKMEENYFTFGLKRGSSAAMPDFVDISETEHYARQARPDKNAKEFKVFSAGRLVPEKRFDLLIRAVAKLKGRLPIKLIIGGDGPNLENLKSIAVDCGAKDMVNFTGWLGRVDLMRNFLECGACVTTQWRPDISSVQLLESMALKTPCLVPADTAFSWIAGDGAITFRQDDINDLAIQIARLADDRELANKLGLAGQKRARELDVWHLTGKLEDLLRRTVKTPDNKTLRA